ncbi:MAG: helix-turn-helix transcriptional regulator [Lachnospiraceae bacterium]|nr:helix-turn-helix transcriptional regulator [Lachnospiraceae bacterium]
MNGIKYIREKSNLSQNALAERMGVTRQTVTLWEKGIRKPDHKHLQWLSEFYGIEGEWFGELSDEKLVLLKEKWMYRHFDVDKEYYTFIPEIDGWREIRIHCGDLEAMIDDRYAETLRKKKEFMQRIEQFLRYEGKSKNKTCVIDKIITAERGMKEIDTFLYLMNLTQKVGEEGTYLKVPFRYEIKTALYAIMVASGKCSMDEIKKEYGNDFIAEGCHIDEGYLEELVAIMSRHWFAERDGLIQSTLAMREETRRARRESSKK